MNPRAGSAATAVKSPYIVAIYLAVGFFSALALRIVIGWPDVSHSVIAGLVFGACLTLLAVSCGVKTFINKRIILTGIFGGFFLCTPAIIFHAGAIGNQAPDGNYITWSLVVAAVAFAEEAFLRGALYDKITAISNQKIAVLVAAIAFAVLHLPLYGWHAVPLDFAVGLWLGALRYSSGNFVAPGIAHVFACLFQPALYRRTEVFLFDCFLFLCL